MDLMTLVARLTLDSSQYESGLDDSEKKASGFGDKVKTAFAVGGTAIAAATTAVAGFGVSAVKATGQLASYGDNIDKMSQKMGISAQAYQEWDAIMQHSGASIDSMQRGMTTLSKLAESNSDAFQALGISQEEVASMNQEELFSRTIAGLQSMEAGTERTVLAQKLLGGSAKELGALLNTSAEDTEEMRKRVHELGGVMSDDAVKAAAAYQDSLQDMQTALNGAKNNIISGFLPAVTNLMDGLTAIFSGDTESGVGMIREGVQNISGVIREALPQIIQAGKEILSGLLQAFIDALPDMLDMGLELMASLITGIINNLPAIISTIVKVVGQMIATILQRLPEFLSLGLQLITSLITGIGNAGKDLLKKIGQLIQDMVKKFKEFDWASLGKSVIDGIISGIKNFGSNLVGSLVDAAKGAYEGAKGFLKIGSPSKLMRDEIGRWIPEGIAEGIKANEKSVYNAMSEIPDVVTSGFNSKEISTNGTSTDLSAVISLLEQIARDGMNVTLAGDARTMFRQVRNEDKKYRTSTGKSAFGY